MLKRLASLHPFRHVPLRRTYSLTEGYDLSSLRQFMDLFPSLPLTSLLKGYFTYRGIPIFDLQEDDSESEHELETPDDDPFDTILVSAYLDVSLVKFTLNQNAHSSIPDSIIANRILASVYLQEGEYQNAIKVAETGLELLRTAETNRGRTLPKQVCSETVFRV